MVQNQTSYQLDHSLSNTAKKADRQQYLNKTGFQTKGCPEVHIQQNAFKAGQRCQSVKLKPLDVQSEFDKKSGACSERKFVFRLNPSNQVLNAVNTNKRIPSKIPVFQRSFFSKNEKHNNIFQESSLSAADRRQKFHQSRLYVAPPCSDIDSNVQLQSKIIVYKEPESQSKANYVSKVSHHSSPAKVLLPPIKNSNPVLVGGESVPQPKKKCLLGEITHFPALCNLSSKRLKNFCGSTVPQLPPLFPPTAPPSSISTSLEQDSNKINSKLN